MVASQAQEHTATSSLLLNAGALQHVFGYVGPGHYLFIAPVSKEWKEMYATLDGQQLTVFDEQKRKRTMCIIKDDAVQLSLSSFFTIRACSREWS
jgi:hypothetical protein